MFLYESVGVEHVEAELAHKEELWKRREQCAIDHTPGFLDQEASRDGMEPMAIGGTAFAERWLGP